MGGTHNSSRFWAQDCWWIARGILFVTCSFAVCWTVLQHFLAMIPLTYDPTFSSRTLRGLGFSGCHTLFFFSLSSGLLIDRACYSVCYMSNVQCVELLFLHWSPWPMTQFSLLGPWWQGLGLVGTTHSSSLLWTQNCWSITHGILFVACSMCSALNSFAALVLHWSSLIHDPIFSSYMCTCREREPEKEEAV